MNNNTLIKIGITAAVGAAVLIAAPGASSADVSLHWMPCPAIVHEPVCDLRIEDQKVVGGGGTKPANVEIATRPANVDLDVSCSTRPINRIVLCAE